MGGGGGSFTSSAIKKTAKAAATPMKLAGNAIKKVGNAEITRDLLGDQVGSAVGRYGEGLEKSARDKPLLALTLPGASAVVEGYKSSQTSQTKTAMQNAEQDAQTEFNALEKSETDNALKSRIKARQEEIMLRQGMTQKSIFGTGKNQPGILG